MAFQTKNFLSIVASMINYMRGVTQKISDYNVGAVSRTMIEAPAIEMDQLYQQMVNGLVEAIPVATYGTFNFPLLSAQGASGPIRVTITSQSSDVVISAGTVFGRPDGAVTYSSIVDITISSGSTYGDVPVVATTTGSITNTVANTSFTPAGSIVGFVSATNLAAFTNGTDQETEAQRLVRFQQYISALPRGTVAAVLYGTQTTKLYDGNGNVTEQVAFAALIEPYLVSDTNPTGLINIYIHNGVGSTSTALVNQALAIVTGYVDANGNNVPGYKAAGVQATMTACTEVPIAVTGTLTSAAAYDHATLVSLATSAIYAYILSIPPGGTCQVNTLNTIVGEIPGVTNFVMSAPTSDTTSTVQQKLMPGTLTVT